MVTRRAVGGGHGSLGLAFAAALAPGVRRQMNVTPVGCQIASASCSTIETSTGGRSTATSTVTTIGGSAAARGAAPAIAAAKAMAPRLVTTSILSAVDGRDRQKFDVRNREERTRLNLEIDRDDVVGNGNAVLRDRDVAVVLLIRVERRAIPEPDDERRVVRARRSDDILANLQLDDAVERSERRETLAMLRARAAVDVGFVLEAHHVDQHHSSSPSMSSSPTSTTTLCMSTRNHSLNVFRSRVAGHADSSSVHAESWKSNSHAAFSSTHSWRSTSRSNSGRRNADPYAFVRGTTTATPPFAKLASVCFIQSMYGCAPMIVTAFRLTTRMCRIVEPFRQRASSPARRPARARRRQCTAPGFWPPAPRAAQAAPCSSSAADDRRPGRRRTARR